MRFDDTAVYQTISSVNDTLENNPTLIYTPMTPTESQSSRPCLSDAPKDDMMSPPHPEDIVSPPESRFGARRSFVQECFNPPRVSFGYTVCADVGTHVIEEHSHRDPFGFRPRRRRNRDIFAYK